MSNQQTLQQVTSDFLQEKLRLNTYNIYSFTNLCQSTPMFQKLLSWRYY